MDFKTIILLLASGQGLLLSLALMSQFRKTNKSNVYLGIIVFVISLEILNDFAMQIKYHSRPQAIPFWVLLSYLLLPPALWMFIRSNFQVTHIHHKWYPLLFVPALIQIVAETTVVILYRVFHFSVSLISSPAWFLFAEVIPVAGMLLVMIIYAHKLTITHRDFSGNQIPAIKNHLRKHLVIFTVLLTLTLLWIVMVFSNLRVFTLIEILMVSCIYVLGYVAYLYPDFFEIPKLIRKTDEDKPAFSEYNDSEMLDKMNALLSSGKMYLKTKLTLQELATELKMPVRYVSYLINTYYKTNFNDFINSYRVKEVINKINDPNEQNKTLLGLALEAGFNSKSAFNEAFKTHTGKPPSSYLKARKYVRNHVSGSPEK